MEEQKQVPAIVIAWNDEEKRVQLQFHPSFKNLSFVLAVLDMARAELEAQRRLGAVRQLEQQAQDDARFRGMLQKGKIHV